MRLMSDRSNRFSPVTGNTRLPPVWTVTAIVLAFSVSLLTVVRFWWLSTPYPSGLDAPQWLSYGGVFFGGAGRSAESTYAPLIPVLAHGLGLYLGPIFGLCVLATAVLVLLAAAIWLLTVRVLGVAWGSLAAALVVPCTAIAEPFFYGGYPQQAALAFGLLGITGLLSLTRSERATDQTRPVLFAGTAFLLASSCHLLYGPLLLASGALVAIGIGVAERELRRYLCLAATCLAPATAASLVVGLSYLDHGYNAPLAVSQRTIQEAWVYAARESPALWAFIVIGGMLASLLAVRRSRVGSLIPEPTRAFGEAVIVGFALAVPGAVLLVASGQPRLAPPVLLGGAILGAFACRMAADTWHFTLPLALSGWIIGVMWLAGTTTGFAREFARYYQVIDASMIAAISSVPITDDGSIAVAANQRGWPVGWWVEALQERTVFTGSNPQWLAFPIERERARATEELFASPDQQVLQQQAEAMGVTYLLLRKWEWIGWDRWLDTPGRTPAVIYDDNQTLVLEVFPATP
jgi:hypothetical protein